MKLLCLVFGHRWEAFSREQCPVEYYICERCDLIKHACNEAFKEQPQ